MLNIHRNTVLCTYCVIHHMCSLNKPVKQSQPPPLSGSGITYSSQLLASPSYTHLYFTAREGLGSFQSQEHGFLNKTRQTAITRAHECTEILISTEKSTLNPPQIHGAWSDQLSQGSHTQSWDKFPDGFGLSGESSHMIETHGNLFFMVSIQATVNLGSLSMWPKKRPPESFYHLSFTRLNTSLSHCHSPTFLLPMYLLCFSSKSFCRERGRERAQESALLSVHAGVSGTNWGWRMYFDRLLQ